MRVRSWGLTVLGLAVAAMAVPAWGQTTGSTGSTGSVGGVGSLPGTSTGSTGTGSIGTGTGTGSTGTGGTSGTSGSGNNLSNANSTGAGGAGYGQNSQNAIRDTQMGSGNLFSSQSGGLFGGGAAGGGTGAGGGRNALGQGARNALGQQGRLGSTNQNQNQAPLIRARVVSAVAAPPVIPAQVSANLATRLNNLPSIPGGVGVQVLMEGKTAVLTGTVPSDREGRVLARLVGLEPGVGRVDNRLLVAGRPVQPSGQPSPSDATGVEVLPRPTNPLIRTFP